MHQAEGWLTRLRSPLTRCRAVKPLSELGNKLEFPLAVRVRKMTTSIR